MEKREVVVIGAGPAGLSASIEAAKRGCKVTLVDENQKPGGQLFKQIHRFFGSKEHKAGIRGFVIGEKLLEEVKNLGVEVWLDSIVYGIFPGKRMGIIKQGSNLSLEAKAIIVSTGAQEKAISFPGWTLPGVMGAGACQTMINIHRVLPGRRVLMVGSGNVGLIVSYQLLQAGAEVVSVVEALPRIGGYLVHAAKIARSGVPILTSHTVIEVKGEMEVKSAVIAPVDENFQPNLEKKREIEVDLITLAVGLSPLAELLYHAGCEFTYNSLLGGWVPLHNEDMMTTVEGVYGAGDSSGVEEASTAMEEGRVAGISAAEYMGYGEWKEDKKEANKRLKAFRIGPFGEERGRAKEEIIREYYERRV